MENLINRFKNDRKTFLKTASRKELMAVYDMIPAHEGMDVYKAYCEKVVQQGLAGEISDFGREEWQRMSIFYGTFMTADQKRFVIDNYADRLHWDIVMCTYDDPSVYTKAFVEKYIDKATKHRNWPYVRHMLSRKNSEVWSAICGRCSDIDDDFIMKHHKHISSACLYISENVTIETAKKLRDFDPDKYSKLVQWLQNEQ